MINTDFLVYRPAWSAEKEIPLHGIGKCGSQFGIAISRKLYIDYEFLL